MAANWSASRARSDDRRAQGDLRNPERQERVKEIVCRNQLFGRMSDSLSVSPEASMDFVKNRGGYPDAELPHVDFLPPGSGNKISPYGFQDSLRG